MIIMFDEDDTYRGTKNQPDESIIHGTGPKVMRIHYMRLDLYEARRRNDWQTVLYKLDELFSEVEAYATSEELKTQKNGETETWGLTKRYMDVMTMIELVQNKQIPKDIYGRTKALELAIYRIVSRLKLDMELKTKKTYLDSTLT